MLPPHPILRFSDVASRPERSDFQSLIESAGVGMFYNARSVLFHLAQTLRKTGRTQVLLPTFHCPSVVEPFIRAGLVPEFYRVDRQLRIDQTDVLARANPDVAAIVFINYFGISSVFEPMLPELRRQDIFVIEDCAHSFLNVSPLAISGMRADAAVYSFWKLVPSQLGGGLWLSPAKRLPMPELHRCPTRETIVRSKRLLEEAILGLGDGSAIARMYAVAERARVSLRNRNKAQIDSSAAAGELGPSNEYAFDARLAYCRPPLPSLEVLKRADLSRLTAARRRNYRTYATHLAPSNRLQMLQAELPPRASPWAFPVILEDRVNHELRLRALGVPVWTFGSTLHHAVTQRAEPSVRHDAEFLSANLACLPVHQMLSEADVFRFANAVRSYLSNEESCGRSAG